MKKLVILFSLMLTCLAALAQGPARLQVNGPEDSYNMVRVNNLTHFTDFSCTAYFIHPEGDKYVVDSTLGTFRLAGYDDTDSQKVRVDRGQWIGVRLPEGMEDVSVTISYTDLPFFDIVQITLSESGAPAALPGEEF